MLNLVPFALALLVAMQNSDSSTKELPTRRFPSFSMQIFLSDSTPNAAMQTTCLLVTDGGALRVEKSMAYMTGGTASRVYIGQLPATVFADLQRIVEDEAFQKLRAKPTAPHMMSDTMYRITLNRRGRDPQIIFFESPFADKPTREAMKPMREWIKTTLKLKIPENKNEAATGCSPI